MIRGFTNDELRRSHGCQNEEQMVFIQRWLELFHDKTLDTYAVKMRNSLSILQEMLATINLVLEEKAKARYIHDLKEEAISILVADKALHHNDPLRFLLLEELNPQKKTDSYFELKLTIEYAIQALNINYQDWLLDGLQQLFVTGQGTNETINTVVSFTESLASLLVNSGWSSRSLFNLVKTPRFAWENFITGWSTFRRALTEKGTFHGFVLVSSSEDLQKLGARVDSTQAATREFASLETCFPNSEINSHLYVFHKTVCTFSYNLHEAVAQCLLDYQGFASVLKHYGCPIDQPRTVYIVLPNGRAIPYEVRAQTLAKDHLSLSDDITSRIGSLSENTRGRMNKVFRQSLLAYEATTSEVQFSNLWIALESLVTSGSMTAGIERITGVVASMLSANYIPRLVTNFLTDCRRCEVYPDYAGKVLSSRDPDAVRDMIKLLQDQDEFTKFLRGCSGHALLKTRARRLRTTMCSNETMSKLLKDHHKRLSWHLGRLYRARNNFMHSAEADEVAPLVKHLDLYLRDMISEVLKRNDGETLDLLLEKISGNYDAIIHMLDKSSKNPIPRDIYWPWLLSGPLFVRS